MCKFMTLYMKDKNKHQTAHVFQEISVFLHLRSLLIVPISNDNMVFTNLDVGTKATLQKKKSSRPRSMNTLKAEQVLNKAPD